MYGDFAENREAKKEQRKRKGNRTEKILIGKARKSQRKTRKNQGKRAKNGRRESEKIKFKKK